MKERNRSEKGQLTYRVEARIPAEKYRELTALLEKSRHHTMSELVRDILYNRKIILETYDVSLDKVMERLSAIRSELHAIGININQVTRAFHRAQAPEGKLFNALEIAKLYQQTDLKVTALFSVIAKLSEQWLPK